MFDAWPNSAVSRLPRSVWIGLLIVLSAALPVLPVGAATAAADDDDRDPALRSLEWREIGPYRGGRSAAVAGIPAQPDVYYFGSTGGGVWKTKDAGGSWKNVSDGFFGGSIGAVAVSAWDPNVIWVGGGEKTVRGNVSHGDGVWRSTDAGKSWKHVGLADTRHIPRIRIHPRNADHVWVAALGHLFGPNEQRGIFRTTDGGTTWEKVLYIDDAVGAVDLVLDPTNPRILYATFWRVLRTPWSLESGGAGSGIWKSTDGGDTWAELTENKGLPKGPLGIAGIAVSPTDPENLYAIIEAEEGGVFRSRDGGETWARTNKDRSLRQRAWYYSRIYADTADVDTVYVLNVGFHRSKDGGKSFQPVATPHGDNHDLWIAPDNPLRMIESNDGGANVSTDGGVTWSVQSNQPTAQMYRVSTDNAFPYRLLGGQQDNSAVRIRSRSAFGGAIGPRDWEPTSGGESGHIAAKPDEPDIVYGGSYGGFLTVVDHRTGSRRAVNVWPDNPMGWGAAELKYRFQWNFPVFFSPHDPNVLYAAGNVLFRTTDGGESWAAVSPDLTRDDKTKMGPSGGPITKDNTSVEYYGTIFAALESPHEQGVLWAGSDDGLIHVSRDDGATWKNVTPKGMPEWMLINGIDAHPFEKGGLYVAGTRYKLDDFEPYLYRTTDYGKSWKRIDAGIPRNQFTRALRADPERPGLLYAGTERGVWVTFDDGKHWETLQLDLPEVPITDLAVKSGNLIAATQGRGFWILDDLSVLHQLTAAVRKSERHFFAPHSTYRLRGGGRRQPTGMGTNPPNGVVFHYLLAEGPAEEPDEEPAEEPAEGPAEEPDEEPGAETELKLEIYDSTGEVIRAFTRKPGDDEDKKDDEESGDRSKDDDTRLLEAEAGLNRFVWDLRYAPAKSFKGVVLWSGTLTGPVAPPGHYRARLTVGEWGADVEFEVVPDPRLELSQADYEAQFGFLIAVRDKVTEAHESIESIRKVRGQLEALERRLGKDENARPLVEAAKALEEGLTEVEEALYQTELKSRQDPLNFPIRLNDKLAGLSRLGSMGDNRPTEQMETVRRELTAAIDAELDNLARLLGADLAALNGLVRENGMAAIAAE